MTDNPILCPYCGAEMTAKTLEGETRWFAWYQCENDARCTATAPISAGETKDVALKYATSAARKRYTPLPEPLTLEELKAMNGEPVWIVEYPDWGHWELSDDADDYVCDRDEDFYDLTMPPNMPDTIGKYGLHGLGWRAYRNKPATLPKEAEGDVD